ncbi:suppressor APC domain-containing protein 1 [Denticeps clupeoides]|uniref:suppressor APC domain-containing protein 1 n=1 Tax=Denticeps clupeoides TaxID=299321 RepID=UPI0010A2F101|nr:suppressor APC domain-containing protein 1 [Denticeps clupeoides]
MACAESYTVVIIPLQSSLYSMDAQRFFFWLKRLKDLEREKDSLWDGLQVVEQARLWYQQRLEQNTARHASVGTEGVSSLLLRSCIQRANGSLGNLMSEPSAWCCADLDTELKWRNIMLVREVSKMNRHISKLELERNGVLQQLNELGYV